MDFLDRTAELARLNALAASPEGGLAVVHGRRRIGKTRLLLEWVHGNDGLYAVADLSSGGLQRRYLAEAIATRLTGFAEVEYPDWRTLLDRLGREARARDWHGPVVLDELPYLVQASPELPSQLQRWLDHGAREAALVVALAGSSQRMMQGLVLSPSEPLFGRAREVIRLGPLPPGETARAIGTRDPRRIVPFWAAWGGVPRYWELATALPGDETDRVDRLVLDPLGPLHEEPDRLLLEEVPPAIALRPILDAVGGGAHRVSEIAGRIGSPATSLSRPLARLVEMELVQRELPFGESERSSKRSLYRIADPFFRLWLRVVAPHRAVLVASGPEARRAVLQRYWPALLAGAWEDLCRAAVPALVPGPWGPAARWWRGAEPEWDVVAESVDGKRLLVGEAKWWSDRPPAQADLRRLARALRARPLPPAGREREVERVLFLPEGTGEVEGVRIVAGQEVLGLG